MDVCIRCNPCWTLQTDEAGKQFCPICGDRFIKEVQPDPVGEAPAPFVVVAAPVEPAPEAVSAAVPADVSTAPNA